MQFKYLAVWFAVGLSYCPDGYQPYDAKCPDQLVRPGKSISAEEQIWTAKRKKHTQKELANYLGRSNMDFNTNELLEKSQGVTIGMAFSGGGYRAMLTGAGAVQAMDDRSPGTLEDGQLGGLLQATTFMTGISGGTWLLGSLFLNNYTTVDSLIRSNKVWQLDKLVAAKSPFQLISKYQTIVADVLGKMNAGFPVTMSDVVGRILSLQLISSPSGGQGMQWSDMINWEWFRKHRAPLPIAVANARTRVDTKVTVEDGAVLEISPFEFGSYDAALNAMFPTQYLGSEVSNGKPKHCQRGLDNAGFVIASSSSVFNRVIYNTLNTLPVPMNGIFKSIYNVFSSSGLDSALYSPNPFSGFSKQTGNRDFLATRNLLTKADTLSVVDGVEDGEAVPFLPLLHRDRQVDVVLAIDASADTKLNWPNGQALVATSNKVKTDQVDFRAPMTNFPKVPDARSMVNLGHTTRPVFYGCFPKVRKNQPIPPLVVYMANAPYSHFANQSNVQMMYSGTDTRNTITNGYNLMTQMNGTRDGDWQTCLSCAILQREVQRQNRQPSKKCQTCLQHYCWDEQTLNTDDITKSQFYSPHLFTDKPKKLGPKHSNNNDDDDDDDDDDNEFGIFSKANNFIKYFLPIF